MRTAAATAALLLLMAWPVQAADEPRGSVEDVHAARAEQSRPFVTVNGNTCFVSRATTYAPRCHVTPVYENPFKPWMAIATWVAIVAVVAACHRDGAECWAHWDRGGRDR